ncbi:hypothetical protein KY326_01200 [Candidatus Woesearchaeota archaeon]|nr:hypothetical protein [Candidatus Woesearchaeota archaeon]
MAKKKETSKVGLKWKRKKWIPIVAPKLFNHREIGTTFIETEADAVGRTIEATLGQLIGNIRKQNVVLKFRISDVQNERAQTVPLEYKLQPASMKRLVRKSMSKIEDSFVCKTKDNVIVRIKSLLTTRSRAKTSAKTAIHHKSRQFIVNYASNVTFEQLIQDLVNMKLQKDIKNNVTKINPLRACHIRYCGIYTKRTPFIIKPVQEEAGEERKKKVEQKPKRPVRKRKKKAETPESAGKQETEAKPKEKKTEEKKEESAPAQTAKPAEAKAEA